MKRVLVIVGFVLLLAVSASAQAPKLGVGAFGGLSMPVLQDDQSQGTMFGARGRFALTPGIVLEPFFASAAWGDPDAVDGVELVSGSKVTAFGLNAALGISPGKPGLKPFFLAGVGSFKVKNDDTGYDESAFGFQGGLGFAFGLAPQFDLDIRGVGMIAPQESGSKKSLNILAGLTFYFGANQ